MNNPVYYLFLTEHSMYKKRIPILPTVIQGIIRCFFYAVIPPQIEIGKNVHFGYNGLGIILHPRSRIGENVSIGPHVTVGGRGQYGVPVIGNNVEIGSGARILGPIRIGNNVKIGANAVVLVDIPDNSTAVGIPARVIKKTCG